jgi:hypothetical protein
MNSKFLRIKKAGSTPAFCYMKLIYLFIICLASILRVA